MSVFVRTGAQSAPSAIVLTATLPTSALADSSAGELIERGDRCSTFPRAEGRADGETGRQELERCRSLACRRLCSVEDQRIDMRFSDGRGKQSWPSNGTARAIEGWWLRPSTETTDRRDPRGLEGRLPLARLQPAGADTWRGNVEPLPDRFSLYAHFSQCGSDRRCGERRARLSFVIPVSNLIGARHTSILAATATP